MIYTHINQQGFQTLNNDLIILRAFNLASGVTLRMFARHQTPDGELHISSWDIVPGTDGSESSISEFAGETILLSVAVTVAAGTVRRGECFVSVELARGSTDINTTYALLLQDYVVSNFPAAWPGSGIRQSIEGAGNLAVQAVAQPAVTAEATFTVPTNTRVKIISACVGFTADANAANRTISLVASRSGVEFYDATVPTAAVANDEFLICAGNGIGLLNSDPQFTLPLPADLTLLAGDTFTTSSVNLQAGDQYSLMNLLTESWIDV